MKILSRTLLFVLCLALLCGLVAVLSLLVHIPWLTAVVTGLMQTYPWVPTVLAVVLVCFIALTVLALVLLVSAPSRRGAYLLRNPEGDVEISKHSIESAVDTSLAGQNDLRRYHSRVTGDPRPGKLKIKVQAEPREGADLAALGSQIQQRIRTDLAECLAIQPTAIEVRLQPVDAGLQSGHGRGQVPRVV